MWYRPNQNHCPFSWIHFKGVTQFDKELVTNILIWLKDYPATEKAWTKALKQYANANKEEQASEVVDLFRKTLEIFLKNIFLTINL